MTKEGILEIFDLQVWGPLGQRQVQGYKHHKHTLATSHGATKTEDQENHITFVPANRRLLINVQSKAVALSMSTQKPREPIPLCRKETLCEQNQSTSHHYRSGHAKPYPPR